MNFKTLPLYLLCPKNSCPETMVPRPKTERGLTRLWVPKFGKIIYRIFSILSQNFVLHRIFLNQNGPSRFFPALGFRRLCVYYIPTFYNTNTFHLLYIPHLSHPLPVCRFSQSFVRYMRSQQSPKKRQSEETAKWRGSVGLMEAMVVEPC